MTAQNSIPLSIPELYDLFRLYPSVQTDTRRLRRGDLFFALRGPSFNGNAFAKAALEAGAAYAVVDDPAFAGDARCILVPDSLLALQDLARYHRRRFSIPFIAITGSNGKTTTKELITAVLRKKYRTYATAGNLNNHIGVPLTLLSIPEDAEMAIIEMGANHLGEIASYCTIAEPTHSLITNCGKAHIEGFGGVEGVRKGKGELYDYLRDHDGTVFRFTDAAYLQEMASGIARQITYGSSDAHYTGKSIMDGIFLGVMIPSPDGSDTALQLQTKLVGAYNFPNVMSAVAVGLSFGVPVMDLAEALAAYEPDNSRSQWLRCGSNEVILDAYNANPSSMKAAIENFAATNMPHKHLWIGGMKEMGAEEQAEHEALVMLIGKHSWDEVILVGPELSFAKAQYPWFADAESAAREIAASPPKEASILIKGSRGSRMERLLDALG